MLPDFQPVQQKPHPNCSKARFALRDGAGREKDSWSCQLGENFGGSFNKKHPSSQPKIQPRNEHPTLTLPWGGGIRYESLEWISAIIEMGKWQNTWNQQPSRVLFTFPNLSKPWKHCNKGSPYLWGIIRPDLDWFSRILVYNHGGQLLTLMFAHIHLAIFGQLLSKFYAAGSSHWPWLGADVCGIALVGGLTQEAF